MYRTRAEIVSGKKVFADGKWLQCIGNKNVRVGDLIWTDGRCVYGHNRISLQPVVITAPEDDDEAIPIIANIELLRNGRLQWFRGIYVFTKGKLKLLGEIEIDNRAFYNGMMINDFKKNIFFNEHNTFDVDETVYETLLATNINKKGERFDVVLISEFIPDYPGSDYGYSNDKEIQIRKNGTVLRTFDIASIFNEEIWKECPEPPELPFVRADLQDFQAYNAFIEDENNWRFCFLGLAGKSYSDEYTGPYDSSSKDPASPFNGLGDWYALTKIYLFSSEGSKLLYRKLRSHFGDTLMVIEDDPPVVEETLADFNNIRFLIQDGYYYLLRYVGVNDTVHFFYCDFFSPKGNKIFSTEILPPYGYATSLSESKIFNLKRVNGGYLFSLSVVGLSAYSGIYFIKNSTVKILGKGRCLNQRLRPMKHIKNWKKNIKELTL